MPKTEQTPRSLIGDENVGPSEHQRVKGQEPPEAGIGAAQVFAEETRSTTDDRQNKHQAFGPNRSFGHVKPEQAMEIKSPGMNVRRITAGTAEPRGISANGVEQPVGVGEEGSEQG